MIPYLEKLGYDIVGYGCMTCIGNSGPLPEPVSQAIEKGELVAAGVLSGNRNFEGEFWKQGYFRYVFFRPNPSPHSGQLLGFATAGYRLCPGRSG